MVHAQKKWNVIESQVRKYFQRMSELESKLLEVDVTNKLLVDKNKVQGDPKDDHLAIN